jgi:methionyl-tRNA synthetase
MIERYFEGIVPVPSSYTEGDLAIQKTVADAAAAADAAIERFRIDEAISSIWTIVDALNLYITENEPWALAKDDAQRERLGTVLYTAAEGLRALAVLLSPVMPKSTEKLWVALGAAESLGRLVDQPIREAGRWGVLVPGSSANGLAPLFPRVEQSV